MKIKLSQIVVRHYRCHILEKDFDFTEKFILKTWEELIKSSKITQVDSKTKLQEYSLKNIKLYLHIN